MKTMKRNSKAKRRKKRPKKFRAKKNLSFFLRRKLFALSLFLSFFFLLLSMKMRVYVCKFDHLFSIYGSLFFLAFCSFSRLFFSCLPVCRR